MKPFRAAAREGADTNGTTILKKHAVIVGGGISGLAAAFELDQAGIGYTLVKRDSRLGGVILTSRIEGCTLEAGPDSFISQKPAALQLIRELGLEDQVIGSNDHLRVTYIRKRGRLVADRKRHV